jgi:hypothetical protein
VHSFVLSSRLPFWVKQSLCFSSSIASLNELADIHAKIESKSGQATSTLKFVKLLNIYHICLSIHDFATFSINHFACHHNILFAESDHPVNFTPFISIPDSGLLYHCSVIGSFSIFINPPAKLPSGTAVVIFVLELLLDTICKLDVDSHTHT